MKQVNQCFTDQLLSIIRVQSDSTAGLQKSHTHKGSSSRTHVIHLGYWTPPKWLTWSTWSGRQPEKILLHLVSLKASWHLWQPILTPWWPENYYSMSQAYHNLLLPEYLTEHKTPTYTITTALVLVFSWLMFNVNFGFCCINWLRVTDISETGAAFLHTLQLPSFSKCEEVQHNLQNSPPLGYISTQFNAVQDTPQHSINICK